MSRIIGSNMAVHHAVQMHQRSAQVARQNTRLIRPVPAQVAAAVREIVEVRPTAEDLARLAEIVSREVEDPGLEFARVETEITQRTPFAGLVHLLPRDRAELVAYLGLLLMIIQTVVMLTQKPVVTVTPEQVQRIIERVVEQVEHDAQAEPPTTTAPDCQHP